MKKLLIVNYWMASIAWSLSLMGHERIGTVLLVCAAFLLAAKKKEFNFWRAAASSLAGLVLIYPVYYKSGICLFFPELRFFLGGTCIHAAFCSEYLCRYKNRYMAPFLLAMAAGMSLLCVLIAVVPDEFYSLFGKANLYLMGCFIFLPYLLPPVFCIVSREAKRMIPSFLLQRRPLKA